MTRAEMRFEAALRESLQLAVSRMRPETDTMEKVVAIGVQFADALLAELDRTATDPPAAELPTSSTACGRVVVSAAELERLERIATAAQELCHSPTWPDKRADDMARLREALKS